ncbi:hypothetical protein CRG98_010954 [Punica granatum]|uniref:PPM-type phosphatase domain-containing protein n=1 Tax=Punica granatum TaxID=22663 RepID=A0A2I0KJI6_PUNGR|nr:hypothetical protein CRG98_010954 [Punica granatum]
MGNSTSRVVGCFVPNGKAGVDLEFSQPLDEGLGHSFCYVRPTMFDSPAITPSNSERFTVDSSTLDSETLSGTASFAAIPLQPIPRGSGPLNGFMSGPLERGFASGPLDRGGGFMSGPMERGVMSGPLDATDKSNFSAPLSRGRKKARLQRLMRSVSGPMRNTISRTFSRHSIGSHWMQRFFWQTQIAWNPRESRLRQEASQNYLEGGPSEGEYASASNLQWAHGKAGEDRVHVVLSEEQGWLFIGIYDGFSGPDAPDFLMAHLYKAIDKELEGLLWDYEFKSSNDHSKGDSNRVTSSSLGEACNSDTIEFQSSNCEITEGKNGNMGNDYDTVSAGNTSSQGRKSMRLYELLQLESNDGQGSDFLAEFGSRRRGGSWDSQQNSNSIFSREGFQNDKLREEENYMDERPIERSGPIRRCVSRAIDHDAILRALERALQSTEEAYMEMVEKSLDKVPELALMGSCVLVMLMKDQDVYVMNLGDSRAILAQERVIPNSSFGKDDVRYRNRSRESLVRMELDRISEESPMHNHCSQINKLNKNKEISLCKLRMRAVQLSADHCTSIEEVGFSVFRNL